MRNKLIWFYQDVEEVSPPPVQESVSILVIVINIIVYFLVCILLIYTLCNSKMSGKSWRHKRSASYETNSNRFCKTKTVSNEWMGYILNRNMYLYVSAKHNQTAAGGRISKSNVFC